MGKHEVSSPVVAALQWCLVQAANRVSDVEALYAEKNTVAEKSTVALYAEKMALDLRCAELDALCAAAAHANEIQIGWERASPLTLPLLYTEFSVVEIPREDPMHKMFSTMVRKSCAGHRETLQSQSFCPAPILEILTISSITNPRLMKFYGVKVEEMLGLRKGGCSPIAPLSHFKIPSGRGAAPGYDLNEHFLFHGARPDVLAEVCRGGFDPRRGGETVGNMFGVATYLAANASKSDLYTEASDQRMPRTAERSLLIARVLVGESHRTATRLPDARRPPDGADGRPLDSVWADTRINGGAVDHLEVMVYDKGQAYPQALVTYRHVPGCQCAECGKRPM